MEQCNGEATHLLIISCQSPHREVLRPLRIKVGKPTPLTLERFDDFFRLLPARAASECSWTVIREEIEAKNFDLKAVNPTPRPRKTPGPRKSFWISSKPRAGSDRDSGEAPVSKVNSIMSVGT
jgi:hypothetical protein